MAEQFSRRILKGATALVLSAAAMASTGATAANATEGVHRHSTPAVAGTGACATGYFCLWGKANYDPHNR